MTADPDPVATAAALTEQFRQMSGHLARLQRSRTRDRRIVRTLAISLAADVLITIGLGYDTVRVNGTQQQSRASQISACRLANVNRGEDIAIWNRLLTIPPGATAAQRAEAKDLERLVRVKDTPRNCVKLYP